MATETNLQNYELMVIFTPVLAEDDYKTAQVEIQMNRDENIMRHMVTRLDKFAVAYNGRKRNKMANAESAS